MYAGLVCSGFLEFEKVPDEDAYDIWWSIDKDIWLSPDKDIGWSPDKDIWRSPDKEVAPRSLEANPLDETRKSESGEKFKRKRKGGGDIYTYLTSKIHWPHYKYRVRRPAA